MKKIISCALITLFIAACSSPKPVKSSGNERANAAKAQSEMSRDIN